MDYCWFKFRVFLPFVWLLKNSTALLISHSWEQENRFMPLTKASERSQMQTALSKFWSQSTNPIFFDDKCYPSNYPSEVVAIARILLLTFWGVLKYYTTSGFHEQFEFPRLLGYSILQNMHPLGINKIDIGIKIKTRELSGILWDVLKV